MSALATQFDFQPGYDLSSLTSANQSQVMQALSQLGPLSNIGGVLIFRNNGGADWPGIINNPRFKRYIWIDTETNPPIMKIYDQSGADAYGNWVSATLADGSVDTAKLAAASVRSDKLSKENPAGGDWAARWICRIKGDGSAVEFCNPNAIFNNSELPRSVIDVTGAPAGVSYLKRDASAGQTTWAKPTFADIDTSSKLSIDRITPSGANNQVLATMAGVNVFDSIPNILIDGSIPVAKLVQAGTPYGTLRRNAAGTDAEWGILPFNTYVAIEDTQDVATSLPLGASAPYNINHGFGGRPLMVIPVLRCTVADLAYSVGDEIPLIQVIDNTAANIGGRACFGYYWNNTLVKFWSYNIAANRATFKKDDGVLTNITGTSWKLKFYAFI